MEPLKYAEQIAYSSKQVLRFTYEKAKEYADKPGVYVECGVAAGAQIIAMAAGAPNKTIYAFDSFEGIPLPSNKDNQMPGIKFLTKAEQEALPDPGKQVLESSGATRVSVKDFYEHLTNALGNKYNVQAVEGWFENTTPVFRAKEISILRLDGDLYNSTYTCLKYLYPKVVKGGLVIIDDWSLPGCQSAVEDYFFEQGLKIPEFKAVEFNIGSVVIYWAK